MSNVKYEKKGEREKMGKKIDQFEMCLEVAKKRGLRKDLYGKVNLIEGQKHTHTQ